MSKLVGFGKLGDSIIAQEIVVFNNIIENYLKMLSYIKLIHVPSNHRVQG